jgi:zinc/manganese transport system substrate-binding protein
MYKLKILLAIATGALAGLLPCAGEARLNVVATVPDLAALAAEVGGKHVSVRAISLPTQDPHFVDAKPSLVLDLNKADLLLAVGLQLEVGWLPVLMTSARNAAIQVGSRGYLECAQFVRLLEVPRQAVDRSMGDIHPGGNPHYLYDPRAAAQVAKGIAAKMSELDASNAGTFQANLAAFLQRLDAARRGWEKRLAPHRGALVLGYHRTLAYLADWLGLSEVEFLEPKPGIPPTPGHVARVIATGQQRKVAALLQESYYPEATSRIVAQKIPVPLVKLFPGTDFNRGQSYIDHVEANVAQLERAFQAKAGAR